MEYFCYGWYIFTAILVAISTILVISCIVRGKGVSHKILIFFTSLLCVVAMLCFGGNAVLSIFGMGWRCKPFNTMLILCFALFIPVLLCGIWQLIHLKDRNAIVIRRGVIAMSLALIAILMSWLLYFIDTSLNDYLSEYNGQTIVIANNSKGSYGSVWRYYIHINDLVHGAEITQDGWHGPRPWEYVS